MLSRNRGAGAPVWGVTGFVGVGAGLTPGFVPAPVPPHVLLPPDYGG